MPALLDTHTFLWMSSDETKLSSKADAYVGSSENRLLLSIASLWEIAIKVSKGKLLVAIPLSELFTTTLTDLSIEILPIRTPHLIKLSELSAHHRDPFDRLLAAQGIIEGIPIVSADAAFDAYGVDRIW